MEDPMTAITTANTASEMVRSAASTAIRVAVRELELYGTGHVAGADEVFAPDVIDHNPATDAAPRASTACGRRSPRSVTDSPSLRDCRRTPPAGTGRLCPR